MKAIAVSILAVAFIAASVITYGAAAKPRVTTRDAEPCIGLDCWPTTLPVKHRPSHRETLSPVW